MAEPVKRTPLAESARKAAPSVGQGLLLRPLQTFKGVGPARAELLRRINLVTVHDLLHHFPIAHKDRESVTPIKQLRAGQEVNVRARIVDVRGRRFGGKEKVEALLQDESGEIRAGWWNPYVADRLTPNAWGFFSGKVTLYNDKRELANAEFEILGDSGDEEAGEPASPSFGRVVPIYNLRPKQRLPSGEEAPEVRINQNLLRRLAWQALESGAAQFIPDRMPRSVIERQKLLPLDRAVAQFHFPETLQQAAEARRRLVFDELFVISLGVALRRAEVDHSAAALKLPLSPNIKARIEARLPFKLTQGQARAFEDIAADAGSTRPMNRLLQGDVGCGKTAVAAAGLLLSVAHGSQAAMLAPTEVLAAQHARNLEKMLENSRVKIGLLRGAAGEAMRKEFLAQLASGEIHIAIGTHALLEPDVKFKSLSLIVVDEQHKFGVAQRMTLRAKGRSPHVLVMTATPIPRTLTLTLYGDLDVSRIDELPPGRGEITTRWVKELDREKVYRLILAEARKGHASYVVLPRIESEGESPRSKVQSPKSAAARPGTLNSGKAGQRNLWSEVKGVEEEFKTLRQHLPTLRMEMLHGRMSGEEKDSVLNKLREGQIDVLVSTQVIEVGVDLPTATVMLIENAEMFGLSALHQLRGRVGRSGRASYCFIFGEPTTDEGKLRLKTFVSTRDGFALAEADFEIRGPGQFFGTKQSGMPELLVADLIKDQPTLIECRKEAFALVQADPLLLKAENAGIRERVNTVLSERLKMVDMG